jgi:hypothetical protein
MKSFRSFKLPVLFQNNRWTRYENKNGVSYNYHIKTYATSWGIEILVGIAFALLLLVSAGSYSQPSSGSYSGRGSIAPSKISTTLSTQSNAFGSNSPGNGSSSAASLSFPHINIETTEFWVGEQADSSNGYISNSPSAWDEAWQSHFGGVDSPNGRNGYLPSGFSPKENPFYFALPYNDFSSTGKRKITAGSCANSHDPSFASYSWCKNTWIAVRHNGKVVYAQWEDVGPFDEDDSSYVFGSSSPKNKQGEKAGLDVSPAVSDYLSLSGSDSCDWSFVPASSVPNGPWKQIITSSKGDSN